MTQDKRTSKHNINHQPQDNQETKQDNHKTKQLQDKTITQKNRTR